MKKLSCLMCIVCAIITLSSCFHNHEEKSAYTIDGQVYKTGFYGDLYTNSESRCFQGDAYEKSDDIWQEEKRIIGEDSDGYRITYSKYDMYSIRLGMWRYLLYVREDQFEAAKAYYASYDAYHYFWACGEKYDYKQIVELEKTEELNQKLNELLNVGKENEEAIANVDFSNLYFFYKISEDGLLTSQRNEFVISGGKLMLFTKLDGATDQTYGVYVGDELSEYFIKLTEM